MSKETIWNIGSYAVMAGGLILNIIGSNIAKKQQQVEIDKSAEKAVEKLLKNVKS